MPTERNLDLSRIEGPMCVNDPGTKLVGSLQGDKEEEQHQGLLVAGGLAGAFLASACCIVPLLLTALGVSGAWIGNLTALEPYRPYVGAVALGLICFGFWRVYIRTKPACDDGTYCARPQSSVIAKSTLWIGLVVTLLALSVNRWAPLFY